MCDLYVNREVKKDAGSAECLYLCSVQGLGKKTAILSVITFFVVWIRFSSGFQEPILPWALFFVVSFWRLCPILETLKWYDRINQQTQM